MKQKWEDKGVLRDLRDILSDQFRLSVIHLNTALCSVFFSKDWVELITYFIMSGLSTDQAQALARNLVSLGFIEPDGSGSFRLTKKGEAMRNALEQTVELDVEFQAGLFDIFGALESLLPEEDQA